MRFFAQLEAAHFFLEVFIITKIELYRKFCEIVGEKNTNRYSKLFLCRCLVNNYDEFKQVVGIVNTYYKEKYGKKINIFYRGQKYNGWSIVSSISRYKGFEKYEEELLDNFISENNIDFNREKLSLNLNSIFLAQHYGIPTRLVDITRDENVALYFAADSFKKNSGEEHNGRVFVMPFNDINNDNDLDYNFWQIKNYRMLENKTNDEIIELYNKSKVDDNSKLTKNDINNQMKCVEYQGSVHGIADRIKAQQGYGVLVPIRVVHYKKKEKPVFNKLYSKIKTNNLIAIDISGSAKSEIMKHLDKEKINESTIFPNDLEHYCKFVVQKYIGRLLEENK